MLEAGSTDVKPKCSRPGRTHLVIRERQTQTTVRYHFVTRSMPIIEAALERMWEVGTCASLVGVQNSLVNWLDSLLNS